MLSNPTGEHLMFFVDEPYVSEFFKRTVKDNAIPVVGTETAKNLDLYPGTNFISENEVIELTQSADIPAIYTNSENAIGWIAKHLAFSDLPGKIDLFKDKLKFRELTQSIFPGFTFKGVQVEDLKDIKFSELPLPFIIKPTVGFFSMGVYKVSSLDEWENTIDSLLAEIDQVKDLYPEEVLNTRSFIIEQLIEGEEYAFDAYFDSTGEPIVLSILKHVFSSDADVSDRVYISSKEIIESNLEAFTEFARKIGALANVKNFPVHVELRRDKNGIILPIEINPMRFGGWCTTADLSFLAYGFNPYLYYYSQKKPDWPEILKGKEGKLFSIIVLDNSTGIDTGKITSFDYEKLLSLFEKPMELRKVDHKSYPLFGFLFTETRQDNYIELENRKHADLTEYISTQ